MKILYFVVFMVFNFSSVIAQTNPFKFKKDHDAILVKDMDASVNFYKEVLGLEEILINGLPGNIRWFRLDDKVQIHLIESTDIPETSKGAHMSLSTPRLGELMDFLEANNIPFENWPGEANTTNTRPDGVKQIYLQDPDGYWIEINNNNL